MAFREWFFRTVLLLPLLALGTPVSLWGQQPAADLIQEFSNPPEHARPYTVWRWLGNTATRDGITRDLEAIRKAGLGGVEFFNVGGPYPTGDMKFMGPEWQSLFEHQVDEAARLGLNFTFHQSDGWGTSGGPWIEPKHAMKRLSWSQTLVRGGQQVRRALPQPRTVQDYYRDVAVLAYPALDTVRSPFTPENVSVSTNHWSGDLRNYVDGHIYSEDHMGISPDDEKESYLQFEIGDPFPAAGISVYLGHHERPIAPEKVRLLAADDTTSWSTVTSFTIDGSGAYVQFPETEAKYFRLVFDTFTPRAAEQQRIFLGEVQLLPPGETPSTPHVRDLELKTGAWVRRRDVLPPGDVRPDWIIAKDRIRNLTDKVTSDGTLEWDAPPGHWTVMRIGYTITGHTTGPATEGGEGLEADKFSETAVDTFFDGYVQKMIDRNADHKHETITHLHADSYEAQGQNWTHDFRAAFQTYRGYEMGSWLLAMTGRVVESVADTERFLYDVRATISDLLANRYYDRLKERSNASGLEFKAQVAGGQQLMPNPVYYGAHVDLVDTEFWVDHGESGTSLRFNGQVKEAISAAHLFGNQLMPAESFTSMIGDYRTTTKELKPIGDKAFAVGLNRFEIHAYIHQPENRYPGWQHYPYGIAFNRKLTWWDSAAGPWLKYLQRCQHLLQQGTPVADVLAFTGDGRPATLEYAYGIDEPSELVPQGYDYDAIDTQTLRHKISVSGGQLQAPSGTRYRVLLLPAETEMTVATLRRIEKLVQRGAVAVGPRPTASPSLKDDSAEVRRIADRVWGASESGSHDYGRGTVYSSTSLAEVLEREDVLRDFAYEHGAPNAELLYNHRRMEEKDVYFLSNQRERDERIHATFRVGDRTPLIFNPRDGTVRKPLVYTSADGRTTLPLHLPPHGSRFVVLVEDDSADHVVRVARDGQPLFPQRRDSARYEHYRTVDGPDADRESGIFVADTPGEYTLTRADGRTKTLSVAPSDVSGPTPVTGPWTVEFKDRWGASAKTQFADLESWSLHSDPLIRYFSGTAQYTTTVSVDNDPEADRRIELDLGEVHDIAVVSLNGTVVDTLFAKPFRVPVTEHLQAGQNRLTVHVTNTWANRLIGDQRFPRDERKTWMPCFTNWGPSDDCATFYTEESPLPKSGLLGPVRLRRTSTVRVTP